MRLWRLLLLTQGRRAGAGRSAGGFGGGRGGRGREQGGGKGGACRKQPPRNIAHGDSKPAGAQKGGRSGGGRRGRTRRGRGGGSDGGGRGGPSKQGGGASAMHADDSDVSPRRFRREVSINRLGDQNATGHAAAAATVRWRSVELDLIGETPPPSAGRRNPPPQLDLGRGAVAQMVWKGTGVGPLALGFGEGRPNVLLQDKQAAACDGQTRPGSFPEGCGAIVGLRHPGRPSESHFEVHFTFLK